MFTRGKRLTHLSLLIIAAAARADQPIGRWGQRTALTSNGLFVYGGKTDQFNSLSYTSAPNTNDLLFLPLNSSFDSISPPWTLLNASPGPAVAWHTISTINDSCLLLLGGQPATSSATLDDTASAFVLDLLNGNRPQWIPSPQSWANEPTRRIRHSVTPCPSGPFFVIGGEKADGSGNAFPDNYIFDPSTPSFIQSSDAGEPTGIYDHASVMLNDGRLLILGGFSQSQGNLVPFSSIWSLNTGSNSSNWSLLSTSSGSLPSPRRAFAATVLYNNNVLIHGGSDAVLQQNYDDGWVLNTSSDPMTWTGVNTLSQLGGRRDHFAVSVRSGYQVLFAFGYGDSAPASPTLYIYDVVGDKFVTTYTPPPPGTSPTQSHPQQSSLTHNPSAQASSSSTSSGDSGNVNRARNIALATTFAGLAIVMAVLVALYYRRRYRQQRGRDGYFSSLRSDDDESRRSQPIPAVIMVDQNFNAEGGSTLVLFNSLHFPRSLASILGRNTGQAVTRRRDMLADEDAYDDEQWYHLRRMRDAERSSWSFKSFVSNRPRSREPSITDSSLVTHRREKSNPFSNEKALHEEAVLLEKEPLSRPDRGSLSIRPPYRDPFADPIQHVHEGRDRADGTSTPLRLPILPSHNQSFSPHFVTTLRPLPEQASQSSLPSNDGPSGSSTEYQDILLGNTAPASISTTLISPVATSFINANPGPATQISRTDSWWKRFTRNSFLDRTLSTTSRKSPSMEIKEYNTLLTPIEEQASPLALKSVTRGSVELVNNQIKSRSASSVYDLSHGRSLSSLRTADTEAIERIGGAVDVIQRVGTRSYHSSLGTGEDVRRSDGRSGDMDNIFMSEEPTMSPTEVEIPNFIDPNHVNTAFGTNDPTRKLGLRSPISTAAKRLSGLVASRVQAYERRLSQDNDVTRHTRGEQGDMVSVKYRLAPRQSLFIANPDGI